MANRPIDAVMAPVPLMRPVTVPSDLVFPRTDGCAAKSAATAEVIILLGLSGKENQTIVGKGSHTKMPRNLA